MLAERSETMARSKVVSLSVHKSNNDRRERKQLRSDMVAAARSIGTESDISAYVVIGVGRNGRCSAIWDTGKSIPLWALPAIVGEAIRTSVNSYLAEQEGEDDFDGGA